MDTARVNFGFMAQEVEEVFPNLVKMDSTTGMYTVNYIGFIPINYSAIKELKKENDILREELNEVKKHLGLNKEKGNNKSTSVSTDVMVNSIPTLGQYSTTANNKNTEISYYYAPETSTSGQLFIFDLQGKQLKEYELSAKNNGTVTFKNEELYAGMFTYTLVVDDVIIDSKQMIIRK